MAILFRLLLQQIKCYLRMKHDSLTQLLVSAGVRFSAVCRSWRRVAQCSSSRHDKKPIWWIFDYFDFDGSRRFFSFADGMIYKLRVPKTVWWFCCGSYEGWVIMQTKCWIGNKVMLLEPLSRVQIHLPIMNLDDLRADDHYTIISCAFLSSPPKSNDGADNNNCLVVAVDFRKNLHLCRIGDKSWTRHDMDDGLLSEFSFWEMLLLPQATTALVPGDRRKCNRVQVMEFDHDLNLRAKIHHLSPWIHGHYWVTNYFVEWRGEILLMVHEFSHGGGIFHVYKIGSSWNLVKVKSLGDGVIFLTNAPPRCFSASDFPVLNLEGNCICYLPILYDREKGIYIFYLEDGRSEWCSRNKRLFSAHMRQFWYKPNIQY